MQATAANTLNDYLLGTLSLDTWESHQAKALQQNHATGRVIACFACQPNTPKLTCIFCRGSGELIVTPVNQGI